jgi:hypothetical protein
VSSQEEFTQLLNDTFVRSGASNATGNGACAALTLRLAPDTYFLDFGEFTGLAAVPSYRLQMTALRERGAEVEPNDTPGEAELAAVDGRDVEMSGVISSAEDVDVYAVRLPPGFGVRAEVFPDSGVCDNFGTKLSALDREGSTLVSQASAPFLCPFIDGTGTSPHHLQAKNLTLVERTAYIAVASNGGVGTPYRVAFTAR